MHCFDPFLFAAVMPAISPAMYKVLTESDEWGEDSLQLLFEWQSPAGAELQLTTRRETESEDSGQMSGGCIIH